jgi:thiaminase/transcriptional activator TenA
MSGRCHTDELWASIEEIYGEILAHPFIGGLTDGSLDREAFRFYVVQDAIYLVEYARALSLAAARAPDAEGILLFARNAAGAIEVERALHEGFFADFGLSDDEVQATPAAPTNLAYTSYLIAVAGGGSFAEGLGALLPCFWIYREVGRALIERGSPDPLYSRWIETYGGEEYGAIVEEVIVLTDRVAAEAGEQERRRMREHFVQTSRYEWMFWDMGYRREAWPV